MKSRRVKIARGSYTLKLTDDGDTWDVFTPGGKLAGKVFDWGSARERQGRTLGRYDPIDTSGKHMAVYGERTLADAVKVVAGERRRSNPSARRQRAPLVAPLAVVLATLGFSAAVFGAGVAARRG